MLINIFFSIFFVIVYWKTCRMFSTYSPKCLSSRLYITVSNQYIYNIFSGGFRGMHKVSAEDRNKITVMGIMTYVSLLPCIIGFLHDVIWISSSDSEERFMFWLYYLFVVIFINIFDEIIGEVIDWIKGKK